METLLSNCWLKKCMLHILKICSIPSAKFPQRRLVINQSPRITISGFKRRSEKNWVWNFIICSLHQIIAIFKDDRSLDRALLIHCSAKTFRSVRHVLGITVFRIRIIYIYIYIKVKWSRYRPGVAQRVGRGITLLSHDRGTRRRWVVSSTPRPHFTPGKDPVPILQDIYIYIYIYILHSAESFLRS